MAGEALARQHQAVADRALDAEAALRAELAEATQLQQEVEKLKKTNRANAKYAVQADALEREKKGLQEQLRAAQEQATTAGLAEKKFRDECREAEQKLANVELMAEEDEKALMSELSSANQNFEAERAAREAIEREQTEAKQDATTSSALRDAEARE